MSQEHARRDAHPALKHAQVREYLRQEIRDLEPGSPLPSERELVERCGVSRATVRHAIDALAAEDLLERVPGRGTFVSSVRVDMQVRLSSYTEEIRRRGMVPSARVLLSRIEPADPAIASALEIRTGDDLFHLYRLRLADGEPMALEHVWLPAHLVPDLWDRRLPQSLYEALDSYGLLPTWGEDSVEGSVANSDEAELLGIDVGAPVLRMRRRAFADETSVEVSAAVYRADRYTLWFPVARPHPPVGRR